jgi:antitoxin (DNA-binding transcriptional repressor) of toxin-antitoxin stability system
LATLPPVATQWLPELHDGVDKMPQVIKLVNQLRRRVMGSAAGFGVAWWSTAIGRGDTLTSGTSGAEVIGLQFHLPTAFPQFTVNFAGEVKDSASAGVFRIRKGGTVGIAASGTVIATLNASSTGFVYATTSALVSLNTDTLITMTLQSTVGHTASFANGFVLGN